MSLLLPRSPGSRAVRRTALSGCLTLGAIPGVIACAQEPREAQESRKPVEPALVAAAERPSWYPEHPPTPTSCGVGCVTGSGKAVVRFEMDRGEYTATLSVTGNKGPFAIGPPVSLSGNAAAWSAVRTFFNPESGVHALKVQATGEWTLNISGNTFEGGRTTGENDPCG